MSHRFQCQCGSLQGLVGEPQQTVRGVCYCKDCRAYSQHLSTTALTHDSQGGAEFVATLAKHVTFSEGMQHLACMSLSDAGLLRWYASCCRAPIANTVRNWKLPYVGLIGSCLKAGPVDFEQSFPRLQMRVNTSGSRQAPPGLRFRTIVSLMGFMPKVMLSGANGTYQQTPFFESPAGVPTVRVAVLSEAERRQACRAA